MLFIQFQTIKHCLKFFNYLSNVVFLVFHSNTFLFLLSKIQSLEHFKVYAMDPVIPNFFGLFFICDVICRIKCPLIICFDKHQSLLDSNYLLDILNILLIDSCTKPKHSNHTGHHKGDIIHSVDVSQKREFNIDKLEVLKKQDNCIEQISTQESRRIYHNSIYVLSSHIHDTKSQ